MGKTLLAKNFHTPKLESHRIIQQQKHLRYNLKATLALFPKEEELVHEYTNLRNLML